MNKYKKLRLFRNVNGAMRNWHPKDKRNRIEHRNRPHIVRRNLGASEGMFIHTYLTEEGKQNILRGVEDCDY